MELQEGVVQKTILCSEVHLADTSRQILTEFYFKHSSIPYCPSEFFTAPAAPAAAVKLATPSIQ